MINQMRKLAPGIMLIILITFVGGTIFLNWGMNLTASGSGRITNAGKINGEEIPLQSFDRAVNQQRQQLQQSGQEIPPEQYRNLPERVWEQKVNEILTGKVLENMDIGFTVDEVYEYMKTHPLPGIDTASVFQTDGAFDTSKYAAFLNDPNSYRTQPWLKQVEAQTKMIIPYEKLGILLQAGIAPTKAEIEYQYHQEKDKIKFEYAKVSKGSFPVENSAITEDMISNYYSTHRDTFKADEQANLYYVKLPKKATKADDKVYYHEMLQMKAHIEAGERTFAEEAKIQSDDPGSAENGGSLGWFGKGSMVPAFDSVAFSIDTGVISEPIKTRYGYHIILVEEREERNGELQVKARHILRKIEPTLATLNKIDAKMDSLRKDIIAKGFIEAAKAYPEVTLDTTGLFEIGDPIPKVGYVPGAVSFAFGRDEEDVSSILQTKDAMYLFAVKNKLKAGVVPLKFVKDEIIATLKDSLSSEKAREYASTMLKKAKDADSLTLLSGDSLITAGVTDTVSRADFVPGVGFNSKVTAAAFSVDKGKVSEIIEEGDGFFIVKPVSKTIVDSIPWDSPEVQRITQQLQNKIKQRIYQNWYLSYRNEADIESNINKIYLD